MAYLIENVQNNGLLEHRNTNSKEKVRQDHEQHTKQMLCMGNLEKGNYVKGEKS